MAGGSLFSGVNVISIVIGILIGRIVIIWAGTVASYSKYTMSCENKKRAEDYQEYNDSLKGSILVTAVVVVIIILIYSWYKKLILIKTLNDHGQTEVDQ